MSPQAMFTNVLTQNKLCYGQASGQIDVIPLLNGQAPYTRCLGTSGTFSSTIGFTNLRAGLYQLYTRDINGCTVNRPIAITHPDGVGISFTKINTTFIDYTDGSKTATGAGGRPPYEFKFGTEGTYNSTNTFF